ncbi:MAG: hypothetical protein JXA42_26885, partial [Anaerolineales bacterium]|nr:hypothetical protein [Anaerolineales bacterium]
MAKKRRKIKKVSHALAETDAVQSLEYEITSEPVEEKNYKRLPRKVKDEFERLHYEAQEQPHKAIPE